MKVWEIGGIVVGCATVFWIVVQTLVTQYFKKAKELEALKRKNTQDAINRLHEKIQGVEGQMSTLAIKMSDHSKSMVHFQTRFDSLSERVAEIIQEANKLQDTMDEKVAKQVRSQVLKLRDDLILLKKRRGNGG